MIPIRILKTYSLIANHIGVNIAFLRRKRYKNFSFYALISAFVFVSFSFGAVSAAPSYAAGTETLRVSPGGATAGDCQGANIAGVANVEGSNYSSFAVCSVFRGREMWEFPNIDNSTVTGPILLVSLNVGFYFTTGTQGEPYELQMSTDGTWTAPIILATYATNSGPTSTLNVSNFPDITANFADLTAVDNFALRFYRTSNGGNDSTEINIAAIELTVTTVAANNTPVVTITAPTTGSSFGTGTNITFTGTATDVEDGNLTAGLTWSSDLDGPIGAGGSFSTTGLSIGSHTITASATDSGSATGTDSITVTILANVSPVVTITAPTNGASFTTGTNITFTGTATDAEDGNLTAGLTWTSSLDGAIGSGGSFSTTGLSIGSHTITASATDSGSATGTDSITVNILADALPVVSITAPANGSSFTIGTLVNFTGTATDAEDGNLGASIQWSSNINGALGSGASLNISTLSLGSHTITASATDSALQTGTDSITVNIVNDQTPVVTITAPADGLNAILGANISFVGTAADPEDGNLTASLVWTSNLDGLIGSGGSFSTTSLGLGSHTITASATDSATNTGTDSITVNVLFDAPPVLTVTSPEFDSFYVSATLITFSGTAIDAEDGAISVNIVWSSNVDGGIGTGASVPFTLSDGIHLVTASITDSASNLVIKKILIYVGVTPPTPHGGYAATTDQCARCHRAHSAENQSLLVYTAAPTINAFCYVCHDGTGAPSAQPISTHSNVNFVSDRQEAAFTLKCTQCHEVHGSGNLGAVRADIVVTTGISTGPVVFTALTGVNSFDESDATDTDDLCATCHEDTNNPGFPMVSHTGGDHTVTGWGDQRGNDCTFCHKHSRDASDATQDGFMPLGCTGCHNSPQNNLDGAPVGGRVAVTGDFTALSHHVVGSITDSQCQTCHDMTTHMDGLVDLYNEDSGALITESAPGEFRTANISGADMTAMTVFCESCHDADGASRLGAAASDPFGDGTAPPEATVHSNVDYASLQEANFTIQCAQCHTSHGSSNLSIINTSIIISAVSTIQSGVVYTSTSGLNSADENDASDSDDLCATCHENSNNSGFPVNSHTGGDHTAAGGGNLLGTDCTGCHTHDLDNNIATDDGFMPPAGGSTCLTCHNQTQGTTPIRRQVVDGNSDGTGAGGDFLRASHHVNGSIPADTDCEVCHDQSAHMSGNVTVFNADNSGTSYVLDDGTTDGADYVAFCSSCHDADASVTAGGAPFSDAVIPPIVDPATWTASSHGGTYSCDYCHSNGHGSNKVKLLSAPNLSSDYTYTADGDPDDPMEEEERFCYLCHDGGVATTDIAAQFALPENRVTLGTGENSLTTLNDRHDVQDSIQAWSGSVIECTNCHNVHGDNAALKVNADPDPTDGRVPGSGYYTQTNTSSFMSDWCMDCHDNSFPASISVTNTLVDVYTASNASGNSHGAGSGAIGTLEGGFGYVEDMWMNCEYCHSLTSHVTPSQNGSGKNNLFNVVGQTYEIDGTWNWTGVAIPDDTGDQVYGLTDQIKDDNLNGYDFCQTCHTGSMGGGNKKANCADCHYHGSSGKW